MTERLSETQTSVFGICLAQVLPKSSLSLLWAEAKASASDMKS